MEILTERDAIKGYENARSTMEHLKPINHLLSNRIWTEICINKPLEVYTDSKEGWERHEVDGITEKWARELTNLVANFIGGTAGQEPSLAATLPTGQRVHIVRVPRIGQGKICVTIRQPSEDLWTLEEMAERGTFNYARHVQSALLTDDERKSFEKMLSDDDALLLDLLREKKFIEFIRTAVQRKKNVVLSGSTGSGKTTLTNAALACIPDDERIITAEDTPEIRLPHLKQHVQLFYNKNVKGSVRGVFEDTLRMYPSRVLPAELRGDEAYFFINNVLNSGHSGTITTIHANNSKLAYQRLGLMIQSSEEGAGLKLESITAMLYSLIEVVIQMNIRYGGDTGMKERIASEFYFDPAYAIKQMG